VVVLDTIGPWGITCLEELIYDADPSQDMHVMLDSPGGDGESAIRLVRSLQARCRELTIIVPDQAKSAATLLLLGAHQIILGPTSDLGPVDPQIAVRPNYEEFIPAKHVISAVEEAAKKIQEAPETLPLYATLLSDVSSIMLQQARAALARTDDLLREALESNPSRTEVDVKILQGRLRERLVDLPQSHSAIFGAKEALAVGLPVKILASSDQQWQIIWRLWTKYFVLRQRIYEGNRNSRPIGSWT